ncbi:MAG: crossover junction endodeoxyribonuclease RuvC [Spirochaetaceae bacterium]|nr:crossover junction endodeoxyribonuclease RuvC [Spirochaetaceae bacterium]
MPKPKGPAGAPPAGDASAGAECKAGPRSGPAFRILGVDPGLAALGWGLVEARGGRLRHLAHGRFATKAGEPMEERLLAIYGFLEELIAEWKPGAAAMEGLFFSRNVTSALPVAEAKGVIRLAFVRSGLALAEYSPTAVKQAVVGTARAEKEQVQEMVRLLLGLAEAPKPDHAADALAVAICRWHHETPLLKK